MSEYVTKIRTDNGDKQIDYNALANLPTTDTTLAVAGRAADAKAVGDAIKTDATLAVAGRAADAKAVGDAIKTDATLSISGRPADAKAVRDMIVKEGLSGVIPINKGGTSATTVKEARTNLGLNGIIATSDDGISYTATVPGIDSLEVGSSFIMIPQRTSNSIEPTVNVNGLGAKNIARYCTAKTTDIYKSYSETWLKDGEPLHLIYDGFRWIVIGLPQVLASELKGIIEIVNGGTGANTASQALTNLGAASATHKHSVNDITNAAPNPNLLDNWYFVDPVNQRGNTSLTGKGYFIDRWEFEEWQATSPKVWLQVDTDYGLVLENSTASGTANSTYIRQYISNPSRLSGKTVTLSAKLYYAGVSGAPRLMIYAKGDTTVTKYYQITSDDGGKTISVTATLPSNITTLYVGIGNFSSNGGRGNFKFGIYSMKLELGSVSTLRDDPPPKKSEQLLECQRYYVKFPDFNVYAGCRNGKLTTSINLPTQLHKSIDKSNITFSNPICYFPTKHYVLEKDDMELVDGGTILKLRFPNPETNTDYLTCSFSFNDFEINADL